MREGLEQAAHQVRGCYRAPAVPSGARQIITTLRVRVTPEGDLAALPLVVAQQSVNAANQPYAGRMAQAAIGAILRCAPLRLPDEFRRNQWSDFDLTFSPLAAG